MGSKAKSSEVQPASHSVSDNAGRPGRATLSPDNTKRFVLGSVMLNDGLFAEVAAMLPAEAFSIEKHRRIFTRMTELAKRDERIDRLTVANELIVQGQIESIDGMGYLVSLDEGIPELPNIESYTRIIREKYDKRRAIFACQRAINQLLIGADETPGVIESLDKTLLDIRAGEDQKHSFRPVFESREFLEARGVF
jgi:replicative DNA helicase